MSRVKGLLVAVLLAALTACGGQSGPVAEIHGPEDDDGYQIDIYVRSGGRTRLVSSGGNGAFDAFQRELPGLAKLMRRQSPFTG